MERRKRNKGSGKERKRRSLLVALEARLGALEGGQAGAETLTSDEGRPVEVGPAVGARGDKVLVRDVGDGERDVALLAQPADQVGVLDAPVEREALLAAEVVLEELLGVAEEGRGRVELLDELVELGRTDARLVREGLRRRLVSVVVSTGRAKLRTIDSESSSMTPRIMLLPTSLNEAAFSTLDPRSMAYEER